MEWNVAQGKLLLSVLRREGGRQLVPLGWILRLLGTGGGPATITGQPCLGIGFDKARLIPDGLSNLDSGAVIEVESPIGRPIESVAGHDGDLVMSSYKAILRCPGSAAEC